MSEYITIEREFDAPLDAVWEQWADPDKLAHWYGPGVDTKLHHFEFAIGGYWHDEMVTARGSVFGRTEFVDIKPGAEIVINQMSADEEGNATDNLMMPNWPSVMQGRVTMSEANGRTQMVFTWAPFEPSRDEMAVFVEMGDRMVQGWNMGFDAMEKALG